jgi:hypothetical protein
MNKITTFGLAILIIYTVSKILNFYGISIDKYGPYLVFYIFLLLCYYILNGEYTKL